MCNRQARYPFKLLAVFQARHLMSVYPERHGCTICRNLRRKPFDLATLGFQPLLDECWCCFIHT